jgi:hypothetical protein
MEKKRVNKKSSAKKPVVDGFLAYQMHKAQNRIGAEYEGSISNVLKGESLK